MLATPPADGTWQDFQIRILPYPEALPSTVTLAIGFKIDSDPESYITSNRIPTGPLFPFLMVYQQFPDGRSPRGFWGSAGREEGFARTMGLVRLALS